MDRHNDINALINKWATQANCYQDKGAESELGNDFLILHHVYSEGLFRHKYSELAALIYHHLADANNTICLSNNIKELFEYSQKRIDQPHYEKTCLSIMKLYDHINLEITRYTLLNNTIAEKMKQINFSDVSTDANHCPSTFEKAFAEIKENNNRAIELASDVSKEMSEIDKKLDENNLSSITSLTIFSAVILAFSGSISFSSSVLASIDAISKFRLIFISCIIGFVVFNTIFLLLYIISMMTHKTIHCQCPHSSKSSHYNKLSCGNHFCVKNYHLPNICCILTRKYPYIFFPNIVILLLMYYDIFAYLCQLKAFTKPLCFLAFMFPLILLAVSFLYVRIKLICFIKRNAVQLAVSILSSNSPIIDKQNFFNYQLKNFGTKKISLRRQYQTCIRYFMSLLYTMEITVEYVGMPIYKIKKENLYQYLKNQNINKLAKLDSPNHGCQSEILTAAETATSKITESEDK